jgi:hypothetical protein
MKIVAKKLPPGLPKVEIQLKKDAGGVKLRLGFYVKPAVNGFLKPFLYLNQPFCSRKAAITCMYMPMPGLKAVQAVVKPLKRAFAAQQGYNC